MTTDTYPEARHAHGRDRRRSRHHQRHRQGRRHDRARHGDDARLRLHRRRDRGRGAACRSLAQARRRDLQRHHRRRRHLDLRHAAAVRHRRGARGAPRIEPATIRGSSVSAPRSTRCCAISPIRWCATARARRNSSTIRVNGAESRSRGAADRHCRSPTRRWSRPRSPARTPIGAASSWRWARPASRPTATRLGDLVRRHPRRGEGRASTRTIARTPAPPT